MCFPVPIRTAAWALPYVLGMATLVVGCSKTERPEVAIRQTTLAAQTPAPPAAPADTADNRFLSFDAATNKVTFLLAAGPFVFDGFGNGQATPTVPPNNTVWLNFAPD